MLRKKYLYNRDGVISNLFPNGGAEIEFQLDGVPDYAFLKKGRYYHDGRLVPENVQLYKYLRIGTKVSEVKNLYKSCIRSLPNTSIFIRCTSTNITSKFWRFTIL